MDMLYESDLKQRLQEVITGQLDIRAFDRWLMDASWDMYNEASGELQETVSQIQMHLVEFSFGELSPSELVESLRPLLEVVPVKWFVEVPAQPNVRFVRQMIRRRSSNEALSDPPVAIMLPGLNSVYQFAALA